MVGPSAGALDAESPKMKITKNNIFRSPTKYCSYGFAPSFACAKLYTFLMVPAYSLPPYASKTT